jgi:hypothetical protein
MKTRRIIKKDGTPSYFIGRNKVAYKDYLKVNPTFDYTPLGSEKRTINGLKQAEKNKNRLRDTKGHFLPKELETFIKKTSKEQKISAKEYIKENESYIESLKIKNKISFAGGQATEMGINHLNRLISKTKNENITFKGKKMQFTKKELQLMLSMLRIHINNNNHSFELILNLKLKKGAIDIDIDIEYFKRVIEISKKVNELLKNKARGKEVSNAELLEAWGNFDDLVYDENEDGIKIVKSGGKPDEDDKKEETPKLS